ncbi:MAG: hypothetical protein H7Y88_09225 [Phycisphaerales bacterium]|nr:hypothetical protein [Phycisphaerales bacterium]
MRPFVLASALLLIHLAASPLAAQPLFSDSFDSAPSPQWGNERGDWTAIGGEYLAQAPTNTPPTFTSLPFELTDLELTLDVSKSPTAASGSAPTPRV